MVEAVSHGELKVEGYGWRCAGLTDIGRSYKVNEDVLVVRLELGLLAVFDGVHDCGVAAVHAANTLEKALDARPVAPGAGAARLQAELQLANRSLFDAGLMGGATVVAALLEPGRATIAHVGDCRAYLLQKNALRRLTRDHSLLGEGFGAGVLTPEEAANSQYKNVITRALWGGLPDVEVEVSTTEVRLEETLLLCSDGLHKQISDQVIAQIVSEHGDLAEGCRALFEAANARGRDNCTVVLARRSV